MMKYIIYGVNRVAKDFMYIFDNLDILYLTDDTGGQEDLCGCHVEKLENALMDTSYDKIIVCDFDKGYKTQKLQEYGLVYGKDYVYEEDFFSELDDMPIPADRKIAIWGTGNMCRFLLEQNLPYQMEGFIDSYKRHDTFMGQPVFLPDEVSDWKQYYIIVAVAEDDEIRDRLLHYGLSENEDFFSYEKVLELPSNLLRRTIFNRSYYDIKCNTMLNHLEVTGNGDTRYCCTTFVRHGVGNILGKSADEFWHSKMHKILCLSTENKTFSFCDKSMCPLFIPANNEPEKHKIENENYQKMKPFPETLALGYDTSCNLSCSTCRKELHFAKGEELETVNEITDKVIEEYLPNCKFLILAGNGEVFASPAYRKIYESSDSQYIRLLSNGTMFTPANWERFARGKTGKIMLTVSVDAATKETYERIRRNGNFDRLKENMEFASRLRKCGSICYFRMNFVVQRENYREMVPFVEWGEALGVDEVFFTKILNWGTYTSEEFARISMMEEDRITPKPELKEILGHPGMKSGIVDMGTIQYSHKVDSVGTVENYYMWELEKRGGRLFR